MEEWNGVSFQRCTDSISPYSARFGTAAKGGSVKGYKGGGSVSRGQYPVQTQKVKFKGVF